MGFNLQYMAPDEVGCVTALLASALAMSRQVFTAVGLADDGAHRRGHDSGMEDDVPGWVALSTASDLLGSGFSRFLEKRAELTRALKREEALKLMQLSWQDEQISPEDAWGMLAGSDGH